MKLEKNNRILALISVALFNFIFLGAEYLFDDMMAYVTDARGVVLAQNYILGVSVIGFIIAPFISKKVSEDAKRILLMIAAISGVSCIFIILQHTDYGVILFAGLLLFVLLGIAGSRAHYIALQAIGNGKNLSKIIGISYALGILIQFINNNMVKTDFVQAIVLAVLAMMFLIILMRLSDTQAESKPEALQKSKRTVKNPKLFAGMLVTCVILMTCVFSTLDNAVTLVHAQGDVDIGQWPRLLLALSGLIAGYLYDIHDRRYMYITMYCVTLLSTVCVVVLEMGGPFLAGLIAFYLSAGFFVIFFTVSFMELSYSMKLPELWAGLGRATNNFCAIITSVLSVTLLSSENNMLMTIIVLVLFALISITIFVCSGQFQQEEAPVVKMEESEEEKFLAFAKTHALTEREQEVLKVLLQSDENIQEIAEQLAISRAALYRHITNLNEKTQTKSRIGLIQFYYAWKK